MGTTNTLDLNNRVSALEKAVSGGDSAQANKSDIATEFNTTTAYTAGCFVYYGGKLYQFNTDHAAGAWDASDVVEANVTDQVVSNKSAIDGLTASDIAYDNTDSGLTATTVQGAVDEVKDALDDITPRTIKSVTADGVKTYAQLLVELHSLGTGGNALKIGSTTFHIANSVNYHSCYFGGNNIIDIYCIYMGTSTAIYKKASILSNNTVSFTDLSDDVPASGTKIELVYM